MRKANRPVDRFSGLSLESVSPTVRGLVVANHGRHVMVARDGRYVLCHLRGKKASAVVGDHVLWHPSEGEGVIDEVIERRNLLYRQDETRVKSFAANLDQVLILIAAEPAYSKRQLARALIAAEAAGIPATIGLNKSDLYEPFQRAWDSLAPYRAMDYPVLPLGLREADDRARQNLKQWCLNKVTLVLGPSGAGKSTLINLLCPDALAQTAELSRSLKSGRHTTTGTTLYEVANHPGTFLIDSPGFQEFGLRHIDPSSLQRLMRDIHRHAHDCRFYNCTHRHEPGCRVIAALTPDSEHKPLDKERYQIYCELLMELSKPHIR
ncbi:MAG: ribosome small subunit-dependent GTPase A [Rhodoferax sp.]|nr:ribosome small subunit-dependent GTPase A [Rhodoferax sp.]